MMAFINTLLSRDQYHLHWTIFYLENTSTSAICLTADIFNIEYYVVQIIAS